MLGLRPALVCLPKGCPIPSGNGMGTGRPPFVLIARKGAAGHLCLPNTSFSPFLCRGKGKKINGDGRCPGGWDRQPKPFPLSEYLFSPFLCRSLSPFLDRGKGKERNSERGKDRQRKGPKGYSGNVLYFFLLITCFHSS